MHRADSNMNYRKLFIKLFFSAYLTLLIGGCAGTGPQYLSKELETRPANELVKLLILIPVRNLHIDGRSIKTDIGLIVYLLPGKHSLKYQKFEMLDKKYIALANVLKEQGYNPSADGTWFKRNEDGSLSSIRPLGVTQIYGWEKKSKDIFCEGGKTYYIL